MFKKIIQLMFVAVITVSPILTNAGAAVPEAKNMASATEKSVFNEGATIQVSKVEQEVIRTAEIKKIDKSNTPTPVNGWFLLFGLLGYVVLSNRMRV